MPTCSTGQPVLHGFGELAEAPSQQRDEYCDIDRQWSGDNRPQPWTPGEKAQGAKRQSRPGAKCIIRHTAAWSSGMLWRGGGFLGCHEAGWPESL